MPAVRVEVKLRLLSFEVEETAVLSCCSTFKTSNFISLWSGSDAFSQNSRGVLKLAEMRDNLYCSFCLALLQRYINLEKHKHGVNRSLMIRIYRCSTENLFFCGFCVSLKDFSDD